MDKSIAKTELPIVNQCLYAVTKENDSLEEVEMADRINQSFTKIKKAYV